MPNFLQAALDKLRPAKYPRIDRHHAAWYPSLPALLTARVAQDSLSFQDLQIFSMQFDWTLALPPPAAAPVAKPLPESPLFEPMDLDNPEPRVPQCGVTDLPVSAGGTYGPRDATSASEVSTPVLKGFLTWLNTVDDKQVGSLARAFHLIMQLA